MGKRVIALLMCLLLTPVPCARALAEQPTDPPTEPLLLQGCVIGIDPGHQLYGDYRREPIAPGSKKKKYRMSAGTSGVSTHVREHVQNLRIGLKLRDALESMGAQVHMTRTTARVNISNRRRALMMNAQNCELVFRLHCNAASRPVTGMIVYYSPIGPAAKNSRRAADMVSDALRRATGCKHMRLARTRGFTGLNWSKVPSVLIEMGYMSNPREDKLLNSDAYQQKLVAGMADAAVRFLRP